MSCHHLSDVRQIAHIGVCGIRIPEGLNLIATLPVGLVGGEHATEVTRLIHKNFRCDAAFLKLATHLTSDVCDFPIGGRRALLFGTEPVPVSIGFVHRTHIVEMDAILTFCLLQHIRDVGSKIIVGIRFQIKSTTSSRIGGESILRQMNWRRIVECQEGRHTTFLRQFQEASLSCLLLEILRTCVTIDLRRIPL